MMPANVYVKCIKAYEQTCRTLQTSLATRFDHVNMYVYVFVGHSIDNLRTIPYVLLRSSQV